MILQNWNYQQFCNVNNHLKNHGRRKKSLCIKIYYLNRLEALHKGQGSAATKL